METAMHRSKWFLPGVTLVLFAGAFAALWIGGDPIGALWVVGVIVGWGLFVALIGRRSETLRGLGAGGRDERFRLIDTRATAFAGTVLILTLIVLWMIETARGHESNPYGSLCALAGISYAAAVVFMRFRG